MPTKRDLELAKAAAAQTDWSRIDALADAEIEQAAQADPDNPPASDEELATAWRATPVAVTAAE